MSSIYDIAKAAGVSVSTVSFVLNGNATKHRISQKTQDRVLAIAKELRYIPNITARKLVSEGWNIPQVALFWDPSQPPLWLSWTVEAAYELNQQRELQEIQLCIPPFKRGELQQHGFLLNGNHYNAAIIPVAFPADVAFLLDRTPQTPIVVQGQRVDGYHSVYVDYAHAGRLAAKAFRDNGHKTAAVMHSSHNAPMAGLRVEGFVRACEEFGIEVLDAVHYDHPSSHEGGRAAALEFLQRGHRPTALFITTDHMALGTLPVFRQHGLQIPRDLEVVAFGALPGTADASPSLTIVSYPDREIAMRSLLLVQQLLFEPRYQPTATQCDAQLVYRESCPAPR